MSKWNDNWWQVVKAQARKADEFFVEKLQPAPPPELVDDDTLAKSFGDEEQEGDSDGQG